MVACTFTRLIQTPNRFYFVIWSIFLRNDIINYIIGHKHIVAVTVQSSLAYLFSSSG
jgi:hypothetical protein